MDHRPVVALDIDGTLGEYHQHFADFAMQWAGRPRKLVEEMPPGLPFYRFLGMSKMTYRQCKLAYRQGGMMRSMPVYDGAAELCKDIRKEGAELWLCTTRPYLSLDNIDPDTRHWLRRNKIQYDHMIFGPHKYKMLSKRVPAAFVIAVLDDLPEQCAEARAAGMPAYIKHHSFNSDISQYPRVMDFMMDPWPGMLMRKILKVRRGDY